MIPMFVLVGLLVARAADAQDLGHKLPGVIGLDAARIPEPGLFVNRVVNYSADELRDRTGREIPTEDLVLRGLSNGIGVSYTSRLSQQKPLSLTLTAAAPIAHLALNIHDRPEASFDRFGLTDFYIEPVRLGWRGQQFDAIGTYALYLPSGRSPLAGGQGLSSGHITHQFAAGGSIFADKNRKVFVTALGSYDINLRKRGIDITRGDTFQIQGGVGVSRIRQLLELGVATCALWQVRDDRGTDLPPLLKGARDRVFGLGPEVAVILTPIRSQLRLRYEWDRGVRSRPQGNILVVGFNYRVP